MIFHPTEKTLSQYLDKDMSEERLAKIGRHLEKCSGCRQKIQDMEKMGGTLVMEQGIPTGIREQFMNRLGDMKRIKTPVCAEIREVMGLVLVRHNGDEKEKEAFPGMALRIGDTVGVLGNSLALLELTDGSVFYLNKETEFHFSDTQYPVTLKMGEFFAMMKPQKEVFQIKTPSALLGVIGTDFDAEVTEDKKTVLRVIKGKVSFQNQAGKVIVKKKKQAEASQHSSPVLSSIRRYSDIVSWTHPVKPPKGRKGTIMKNLFWLCAILVIVICAISYFKKEETPKEVKEAKEQTTGAASILMDDNAPLDTSSPYTVQGSSWKVHTVTQIEGSQGPNVEYDFTLEVAQSDKQNGSLVVLTLDNMKDPNFGTEGAKGIIGKKYSFRISPEGNFHSPGTYDGSDLNGMEIVIFFRLMAYYVMSDLFINKHIIKDQEWTTSLDFAIPGYPESFVRGKSAYRLTGYTNYKGKEAAVISHAGVVSMGGLSITMAEDSNRRMQMDIENISVDNQNEYYIERDTGRLVGMDGRFKEYDRRMTHVQYTKGRQEPIKRPSNPAGISRGSTVITIEY